MSAIHSIRVLPAVPESVREARRVVRLVAEDAGFGAVDDAVTCMSELVTNAVTHSMSAQGGKVRVTILGAPGAYLRLEVKDAGPVSPPVMVPGQPAAPDAEDGRGLFLVAALAKSWDTNGRGLWWCQFDWSSAAPVGPFAQGDLFSLAEAGDLR